MSPTCMIKPKQQSMDQQKSKSKYEKNKPKHKTERSLTTAQTKSEDDDHIYIELDIKCSCLQSKLNNHASIQFSRRYLQCQSSMPIAILRSYIQQILPHSSMTQVSFFDENDQLLNDSHLLRSLTKSTTTDNNIHHIPIRFTLFNTITSLSHCTCSSSSFSSTEQNIPLSSKQSSSTYASVIKRETIDQTLSTCSLIPSTSVYSPCLSSSSTSTSSSPSRIANGELSNSVAVSIVNLLTPPSSSSTSSYHSSLSIENLVESNQSIIDEITSQFGEICPPLPSSSSRKKNRNRSSKKMMMSSVTSNMPLDLSLKKRPLSASSSSSYDMYSSQAKWIKT